MTSFEKVKSFFNDKHITFEIEEDGKCISVENSPEVIIVSKEEYKIFWDEVSPDLDLSGAYYPDTQKCYWYIREKK